MALRSARHLSVFVRAPWGQRRVGSDLGGLKGLLSLGSLLLFVSLVGNYYRGSALEINFSRAGKKRSEFIRIDGVGAQVLTLRSKDHRSEGISFIFLY